jgi:hypothetical protein
MYKKKGEKEKRNRIEKEKMKKGVKRRRRGKL